LYGKVLDLYVSALLAYVLPIIVDRQVVEIPRGRRIASSRITGLNMRRLGVLEIVKAHGSRCACSMSFREAMTYGPATEAWYFVVGHIRPLPGGGARGVRFGPAVESDRW